MNIGDTVIIYTDPLTEKTPEGEATLHKKRKGVGSWYGRDLEQWLVKFAGEDAYFIREILVPK
jgi:hypothetical protein